MLPNIECAQQSITMGDATMKRVLVLIVFVCFPILYAGAQTTAQISGTVQDSSGAAVAGAQVQVTNVDTNAIRTTLTSDAGAYLFPSLEIGSYKLSVTKEGFVTYAQTGIVLQVNTNPEINVALQVGAVTQTVEVRANAAMVETESNAGLSQVIQPEQILDLPLNGRQATQLIGLSGAAVNTALNSVGNGGVVNNLDNGGGTTAGSTIGNSAVAFSVAGSQPNATNYFLDGSVNMDYRTNVGLPLPFPDALQEFSVQTSALPANLGSHPGGSVNAVTKSGGNAFHGDLFEFMRNTDMDADLVRYPSVSGTLPAVIPDNLKRNQFGGTIGGPIKKNKLFFFYGFQGTTERVNGALTTVNVPTALTLAGNFTAMLAPPCQKTQVFLSSTYTTAPNSNILKPGLYGTIANGGNSSSQVAAKLATFLPTPVDACGDASYHLLTSDGEKQNIIRSDWQRNQNDTIFLRYFISDYTLQPSYQTGNILSASAPGLSDRAQSVDIGDTHVFSSRLINSLRLSFARTATVRTSPPGIPTWTQLGVAATTQVANYTGQNSITGYFSPGATDLSLFSWTADYCQNIFGITDSIGWSVGSHQLTFGGNWMHVQMNDDGLFQVNPNFTFNGTITGNALADFITGNPSAMTQGGGQLGRDSQNQPALFFQDNWKITRRFQVNYGLRWDPFIPQYNKYKEASDFSYASFVQGKVSSIYTNAPPGVTFPGDHGFNERSDTNEHLWDFSPRVGFVWDPRGKGLETIRAAYGMFYDSSTLWNTMHIVLNPPWGETISITPALQSAGGGLANPWFQVNGGNPFPFSLNQPSNVAFPLNGAYVFQDQGIKPTNVQQWNVALQKQFGGDWLASLTYLGSKTTHQWLGDTMNPSDIITAGETTVPGSISDPASVSAPGIVSTSGMTGTSGPCTLNYGGVNVTWPLCNGFTNEKATITLPGTTTPTTITNEQARKNFVLANPTSGPLIGTLAQDFSNGNAAYQGLLASLQHRLSQNFSVLTNFTWSHCEDQGEIGQDIGNAFQNPINRKADWGNCAQDRRKIFNLAFVVQSPRYESRLLRAVAGNWNASGGFTATSGAWLNVTDGGTAEDVSLSGVGADRPDEISNPFVAGPVAANPTCTAPATVHTIKNWFNPCAFVAAPAGTFGSLGKNALLGPGNWNFDADIWKGFTIKEGMTLEFRAEAFNVLNHLQIGNPNLGIYSNIAVSATTGAETLTPNASAGLITTSSPGNARQLQLALKLTF